MMRKLVLLALVLVLGLGTQLPIAQAAAHGLGSNIITPQGTVFTITKENGQTVRRPYTSPGAFLSYGYNTWETVVGASVEDLTLPTGSFIAPQDGKVMCSDRGSDQGTCYLITGGKKAGFTSEYVFRQLGYDFRYSMMGDVSFLPSTVNIDTPTAPHKAGTLVNKDGTIYLVSGNGLLGLPSWATLQSWGYISTDIVPANSADRSLPVVGTLTSKQPEQISVPTEPNLTPPPASSYGHLQLSWNSTNSTQISATPLGDVDGQSVAAYTIRNVSNESVVVRELAFSLADNTNLTQTDVSGFSWWLTQNGMQRKVLSQAYTQNQPMTIRNLYILPFSINGQQDMDVTTLQPGESVVVTIRVHVGSSPVSGRFGDIKLIAMNYRPASGGDKSTQEGSFPTAAVRFSIWSNGPAANYSIETGSQLPTATVGQTYATGINYSYSGQHSLNAAFTSLPAGLWTGIGAGSLTNINMTPASNGGHGTVYISGMPTQAGTYNFDLYINDPNYGGQGSAGISKSFTLVVNPQASGSQTMNITTPSAGNTYYAGQTLPMYWTKTGNFSMPNTYYFVYLKTTSGQILGSSSYAGGYTPIVFRSPTLPQPSFPFTIPSVTTGQYYLEVDYTDENGRPLASTTSDAFTISSSAPLSINTTTLPNATAGQAYSTQIEAAGGMGPYTWSPISTTYPSGCCVLGLNGETGTFNTQSGLTVPITPTGSFSWVLKVTDALGSTATKTLYLTINP